jgi:hypothetical protein
MSNKNPVHGTANKSSIQGRFTPDFRMDSLRSKSFDKHPEQSTSRRALNTPNFSKKNSKAKEEFFDSQTTFGNEKKLMIPKLPLDTLLEEDSVSLNLSTIVMENSDNLGKKQKNEGNELIQLLEGPEDWDASQKKKKYACLDDSSIVDSQCKVLISNKNVQNLHIPKENLKKQTQKYDKALILLQAHFQTYKEHAEKQIIGLTQELAEAKAVLKTQVIERDAVVSVFKQQIKSFKSELEAQFRSHLRTLEQKLSEKEQSRRESTDERIQQLRKDFEKKASDSNREERLRSNSKGYIVLVEENKRLREDLTNLWKDTDLLTKKLHRK